MATADVKATLGPHLPYLRRYGRALTGSQQSGDAFVRAALEALLTDPDAFQADNPPRVELFRLFHRIWSPIARGVTGNRFDPQQWAEKPKTAGEDVLAELSRPHRAALLLTTLEGFSLADTAIILDADPDDVDADIRSARDEIAQALCGRVLIIEDEPVIALHLQSILEDMGHHVIGHAATHREAIALHDEHEPELVLADIRLADGSSGIDAVRDILASHDVPVVFITAYPERLLTGERPEPTYLVTKPFDDDTIVTTIGQALMLRRAEGAFS